MAVCLSPGVITGFLVVCREFVVDQFEEMGISTSVVPGCLPKGLPVDVVDRLPGPFMSFAQVLEKGWLGCGSPYGCCIVTMNRALL